MRREGRGKRYLFVCVHDSGRSQMAEAWGLEDPAGKGIEHVRRIRDQIETKVGELLAEA